VRHQGKNYRWGTGIVINNKDPLWLPHNPSYDGSCLEFHTYPGERWGLNDEACTTKTDRWVVCSKGPTVPTAALDLVDGRKFFCQGKLEMNRKEADAHCRSRGMVLPTVKDLHTANRIVNHCGIKCTGHCAFWLDAVRHQGKNYRWGTGIVINNKDPLWLPHNPSYDGSCLEFHTYPGERWGLNDEACTTKTDRWVVCSKAPADAAPKIVDGRKFFCQGELELNRKEADNHCRSRGMVLPTVKDLHTVRVIWNHCGIKCAGHCGFWVDAMRENHSSNYSRWSTGSIIDRNDPIWLEHNPTYDGPCLEFHTYPGSKKGPALNDEACTTRKNRWVVCEKRPW